MTARTPVTSGLFASPSPLSLLTAARWLPTRFRLDSPDSPPCCSPERVHVGRTFPHLCDLGDSAKYANRTRKIPNTPPRRSSVRRALRADQRVHDAPEREDVARRPPAVGAAALHVLHDADQDERRALGPRGREPEALRVRDRPVALAVNQDQARPD